MTTEFKAYGNYALANYIACRLEDEKVSGTILSHRREELWSAILALHERIAVAFAKPCLTTNQAPSCPS